MEHPYSVPQLADDNMLFGAMLLMNWVVTQELVYCINLTVRQNPKDW